MNTINVKKSDEILYHLIIQNNNDDYIDTFELLHKLIIDINARQGNQFSINTITNDISSYYGRMLYPKIINIEKLVRKTIYLFMLKTVGSDWLEKETPEKFQRHIDSVISKNNLDPSVVDADQLNYADFIALGYFFTAPYAFEIKTNDLFAEIRKIVEKDPTKFTSDVIDRLSDEYEQKNN